MQLSLCNVPIYMFSDALNSFLKLVLGYGVNIKIKSKVQNLSLKMLHRNFWLKWKRHILVSGLKKKARIIKVFLVLVF